MALRAWWMVRSATAVLGAGLAAVCGAHSASAATVRGAQDTVVAYSDRGDWVGQGAQQLWRGTDSTISIDGDAGSVGVSVSGGPSGQYFTFNLASPSGTPLGVGVYTEAERTPFRSGGHPGIDIFGSGRGCNTDAGRFEIRDIGRDATGSVTRLWAVYEQHCEGGGPAMWGEIRIGLLATPRSSATVPSVVRWPVGDAGSKRTTVPVTVVAGSSGLTVDRVGLGGADAKQFRVREDGCSGREVPAGRTCQVWVGFAGDEPATREGTLSVVDAAGGRYDTALQGWSYGGTTSFRLSGDPGDYISGGRTSVFTPANASIAVQGTRGGLDASITGADGTWWYASVSPPTGDILVAGDTYAPARRNPFRGSSAGLDVSGDGRGCNVLTGAFTMNDARWYENGSVRTAAYDFEQHCDDGDPAARGSLLWRVGDTAADAAWMRSSPAPTTLPVPPSTVTPTETTTTPATPPTPPTTTSTAPTTTSPSTPPTTTTTPATQPTTTTTASTPPTTTSPSPTTTAPAPTGSASSGTPSGGSSSTLPAGTSTTSDGSSSRVGASPIAPTRPFVTPAPRPATAATASGVPAATPAAGAAAMPLLSFAGLRSGGRTLRFTVRLPRAGTATLTPSATVRGPGGRARVLRLGRARVTSRRAGSRTVSVRLTSRTRRLLARNDSAPMTTRLTWRATGGSAVTSRADDVLRMR